MYSIFNDQKNFLIIRQGSFDHSKTNKKSFKNEFEFLALLFQNNQNFDGRCQKILMEKNLEIDAA